MDFFEAQDRAKRNTGKLVFLYLLAVTGIVFSVYLAVTLLFYSQGFSGGVWNPGLFLIVSAVVLLVISIGTLFRIAQLRKGGSAVAEMLGGRKLEPSTTNPAEKQLRNVVEEMSIASGIPVPDVYILDNEENINAFAAGLTTQDAAVGVTRGTLDQLDRDELQGVIAHEFSHIFNGDMRLNIRLIGILNGILLIHIMGMVLIRGMFYSGGVRVKSNRDNNGGGKSKLIIMLFGLALIVIGYIGMIFGRMIQSAISRQREYLADAAAVQYTRNPDGLAGALKKISESADGAKIQDGHSMEMSHLFFASSFHSFFDKLYSTHPPIDKRIQAISPSLSSDDSNKAKRIRKKFEQDHVSGSNVSGTSERGIGGHEALTPEVILATIGTLNSDNVSQAGKLLGEIPEKLVKAAHEPFSAEALVYALLLTAEESEKTSTPAWLHESLENSLSEEVEKLTSELQAGNRKWCLPLAELSFPALRQMSEGQYKSFRGTLKKLAEEGDSIFSFAIEKLIQRQLDTAFAKSKDPKIRHHHLKTLGEEISVLLSALSYISDEDPESAWQNGLKPIEKVMPDNIRFLPKDECGLGRLNTAIDEIATSANPVKKYVASAMIHCVVADKKITVREKEMLRAITVSIGFPIPLGAMMDDR
ncbi:M48 family metalloprotease [Gracilimonas sp.]|uniref:M48 family metalloprotease n=1 Tax=Gracilimonas sp. TaxID=1974203 RepID=UPI002871FD24|nr:M48 family metalloprotease [Gracilimonas sp.]